uniref:Tryptophan aminotransferase related protein n=2 Tax=Juncus TaxID=13578 RepID=A0A510L9M4_9POAL|nr:tryptophan aminotransferase related protein [Juncus prismatocarpus subsp. leschenaultii]BBM60842.1 tryptophan aminotransferase related protein [Juncus wallichianus]
MAKSRKVNAKQGKMGQSNVYNLGTNTVLFFLTLNLVLTVLLMGGLYKHASWTTPKQRRTNREITGEQMEKKAITIDPNSIINLDHGDPTMFESFWKDMGEKATVVIPGWHMMSYFSNASNLCWFLEPEFANQVRRLHRTVGNALTDDRHIIVGVGSTQLIHATLYALTSVEERQPVDVISAAPFYSMYPGITNFLKSGLFKWAGDAKAYTGDSNFIEIICSPNNPDGELRNPILVSQNPGNQIHDMAYYWPQYTPMRGPVDHDITLFTVSKATGHAGTRIGWALVKDADVARRMVKFIEMNSIGVSKDSQVRAAKILELVSDGYEFPDLGKPRLFDFGRRLMADRWQRLRQAVEVSGKFSLPDFPSEFCEFTKELAETYPAFAWLRCEGDAGEDCEGFFGRLKILTRSGTHFGAGPEYVRISMLDRDANFDEFIRRISSQA